MPSYQQVQLVVGIYGGQTKVFTSMRYDLISTGSRREQNRSRVRSSSKDSIVVRGNKAGTVECSKLLVENDMDFRRC